MVEVCRAKKGDSVVINQANFAKFDICHLAPFPGSHQAVIRLSLNERDLFGVEVVVLINELVYAAASDGELGGRNGPGVRVLLELWVSSYHFRCPRITFDFW